MSFSDLDRKSSPVSRLRHLISVGSRNRSVDRTLRVAVQRLRDEAAPVRGLTQTLAIVDTVRTEAERQRARRNRFRRIGLSASALVVPATLFGACWLSWLDIDPDVRIPMPAMPSPNAFDDLKKAGTMAIEADKNGPGSGSTFGAGFAGMMGDPPVKQGAAAALPSHLPGQHPHDTSTPGKKSTTPQLRNRAITSNSHDIPTPEQERHALEALDQKNAPAFALLRHSLSLPFLAPPIRKSSDTMPYLANFRKLARLLADQSKVRSLHGDVAGAADSSLDAITMGQQIQHGGILIHALVGIACEAIGRKQLWNLIPSLNATQCREVTRRMQTAIALQVPTTDTLQEEKWLGESELLAIFHDARWRTAGFWQKPDDNVPYINKLHFLMAILHYSKRDILQNYVRYMDGEIAYVCRPYNTGVKPTLPDDPLNPLLLPVFSDFVFLQTLSETQNSLLLVSVALRAYHLEHGSYPETLQSLVSGGYLNQVPEDPFAAHQSIRYRLLQHKISIPDPLSHISLRPGPWKRPTSPNFRLYSIGPDGIDQGGDPVARHDKTSSVQLLYKVFINSTGDIEAGLNTN